VGLLSGSGDGTVGEDEIDSGYRVKGEAPHTGCEAEPTKSYGRFQMRDT